MVAAVAGDTVEYLMWLQGLHMQVFWYRLSGYCATQQFARPDPAGLGFDDGQLSLHFVSRICSLSVIHAGKNLHDR